MYNKKINDSSRLPFQAIVYDLNKKNLGHKALCLINGETALHHFAVNFGDFNDFETIFLCRNEDLNRTDLKSQDPISL